MYSVDRPKKRRKERHCLCREEEGVVNTMAADVSETVSGDRRRKSITGSDSLVDISVKAIKYGYTAKLALVKVHHFII